MKEKINKDLMWSRISRYWGSIILKVFADTANFSWFILFIFSY